jgi:hypothetical protein
MKESLKLNIMGLLINEDELMYLKGGDLPTGCDFVCWVH